MAGIAREALRAYVGVGWLRRTEPVAAAEEASQSAVGLDGVPLGFIPVDECPHPDDCRDGTICGACGFDVWVGPF